MKLRFITIAAALGFLVSCKKSDSGGGPTPPNNPPATDKIKDSVLLYSRDIYLWYNQIPSSFNAQSYADPDKIMTAIRAYSTEPGFSTAVDRWSFGMKQVDWDNLSNGSELDFGMNVFFRVEGDLRVRFVEKASPAGLAGVRRGWKVTKINGSTNITTANADFIVDAVYNSTATNFTFQKPDGNSVDVSLTTAAYQSHPVFLDSVYTVGPKKVGYFVFNAFLGDTNEINNEFQRVFTRFSTESVNDVVVDLRYNGGGYVDLSQKLANYLVKSSANGQVMMSQEFNANYPTFNETTTFQKLGALNLDRVFFIVSENTASASELLINNLKPFMNVITLGPDKTYGKPVGYFPIPVGEWYIFPISFRSTNKDGVGNYFNGLDLNNTVGDGLDKDWGDVDELAFSSALKFISTGAFRPEPGITGAASPELKAGNKALDASLFKGAVAPIRKFH